MNNPAVGFRGRLSESSQVFILFFLDHPHFLPLSETKEQHINQKKPLLRNGTDVTPFSLRISPTRYLKQQMMCMLLLINGLVNMVFQSSKVVYVQLPDLVVVKHASPVPAGVWPESKNPTVPGRSRHQGKRAVLGVFGMKK